MELQTFYENIGADYQVVLQRLRRESLIDKYLHLLLKDPVFETLQHAVESDDHEEIFRAAHTIKGMALNLELPPLTAASSSLTEYLRTLSPGEADSRSGKEKYADIVGCNNGKRSGSVAESEKPN